MISDRVSSLAQPNLFGIKGFVVVVVVVFVWAQRCTVVKNRQELSGMFSAKTKSLKSTI
jgi:hypothetical protein